VKAAILVGGYGKRLRPLTDVKPKPLLEVAGKPILARQVEWLKEHRVNEVVLCVGYLKGKIIEYVGGGGKFGLKVSYVVEEQPLGKGGALKNAEAFLNGEEKFLVVNGDILTNLDPKRLVEAVDEVAGAIALVPLRSPFGVVDTDEDGFARRFREKPVIPEYWINAGVYALSPEVFGYLPREGDIEKTAFPALARLSLLKAVAYPDAMWKSVDSHKDLEEAGKLLSKGQKR